MNVATRALQTPLGELIIIGWFIVNGYLDLPCLIVSLRLRWSKDGPHHPVRNPSLADRLGYHPHSPIRDGPSRVHPMDDGHRVHG